MREGEESAITQEQERVAATDLTADSDALSSMPIGLGISTRSAGDVIFRRRELIQWVIRVLYRLRHKTFLGWEVLLYLALNVPLSAEYHIIFSR
jgi:hypothetical protein